MKTEQCQTCGKTIVIYKTPRTKDGEFDAVTYSRLKMRERRAAAKAKKEAEKGNPHG
jgi:hypothetical protein